MPQAQAEIIFDNVSLSRDGRAILKNISLTLRERRIGLIGGNGSGKTSFMQMLNGLIAPSRGRISIDGLDTKAQAASVRRRVGFVFQNPDMQIIQPKLAEDIAFGLHNLRLPQAEIRARVQNILAEYGLAPLADREIRDLSGGQKQLAALCGVLVMRPAILALDEPTGQLDLRHKNYIMRILRNLPQRLLMTTHDLPLLRDFDRLLVLDSGEIIFDGVPKTAIAFYEKYIEELPLPA